MPIYEFMCEDCEHEWEDLLSSWKSPLPEECPECGEKKVKKLISWCNGTVELSGKEYSDSLKAAGAKLAADAQTNENLAANLTNGGEAAYHAKELANDKLKKDLNIK